jgi:hypothetical protein
MKTHALLITILLVALAVAIATLPKQSPVTEPTVTHIQPSPPWLGFDPTPIPFSDN